MRPVRKTIKGNTTFTVPNGVKSLTLKAVRYPRSYQQNNNDSVSIYTCYFLDSAGNLFSYGEGSSGGLGDGTSVKKSSPVLVIGGLKFKQFNSSDPSAWGLTEQGNLYAWGGNGFGRLGTGDVTSKSSPVLVVGGLRWATISRNASQLMGMTEAGQCYMSGVGSQGSLGVGDNTNRSSPTLVVGGLSFSVDPESYGQNSVLGNCWAVTTNGDAYSWGTNSNGFLGDGTIATKSSPVLVVGGLKWKSLIFKYFYSYGITTDGQLYSWGTNTKGLLADGTLTHRSSPVLVIGGLRVKSLSVSITNAVAADLTNAILTVDGDAYCWGCNVSGECGNGSQQAINGISSPVLVIGGLKFKKVSGNVALSAAGGAAYFMGLTESGDLYGWGGNGYGNLGDGAGLDRSSPTLVVGGLKFSDFEALASGVRAMTTDGRLYSWGNNNVNGGGSRAGQLGDGTTSISRSSPVLVVGAFSPTVQNFVSKSTVSVVPGTSYDVRLQQNSSCFGPYALGAGAFDELIIEYFQ